MADAIVGFTGFVGSNLASQHSFEFQYNSKNIAAIIGGEFSLLTISAMPAAMYLANNDPEGDRKILDDLLTNVCRASASQVVIISTVAVYPYPVGVSEDSSIDCDAQTPYGRHRFQLEQRLADHFPSVLSVRLPGLFGHGLKKNVVFDFLHGNQIHKINSASLYQYYNLDRLWRDVSVALAAGLNTVNLSTEPVSVNEMAREVFDLDFVNDPGTTPVHFDVRTRHYGIFGGRNGYVSDRYEVLTEMRSFVQKQKLIGESG